MSINGKKYLDYLDLYETTKSVEIVFKTPYFEVIVANELLTVEFQGIHGSALCNAIVVLPAGYQAFCLKQN